MDQEALLRLLHVAYTLELGQVALYSSQVEHVKDQDIRQTLERIILTEQSHADSIAQKIGEFGAKPIKVAEVFAPFAASVVGKVSSAVGLEKMLQADIALEKRAKQDYQALVNRLGPNHTLYETLRNHLVDENLHATWFTSKISELKHGDSPAH